uniref:Uncharacterized protein n=1 Tax=Amphimedon queenslandica TaxID=400682 RepID=A0A1X7UCE5_AMPQE
MLLCLVILLQLLQLIVSHEAPTVRFRSRKQLIFEGEAIDICVYVRDGPFSVLTLAMELYDLSVFESNATLFEVNVTSTGETCFALNEDLISREPYNAYILVMPFDYYDNMSEYHVGFPFFLKLFVTGLPPPPCPCEERLALIACKVLETKGEELPTPCIKALYPKCFKRKGRKRCGRRRGPGGGCGGGSCGGDNVLE